MTNIKNAIVLCAGKSSRFEDGNKLYQNINGKTLPQHIINFCEENGFKNIFVTINKDDLKFDYYSEVISNKIMDDMKREISSIYHDHCPILHFQFQNDNEYGPAAAIKPWIEDCSDSINSDFIVLFGDNFYKGKLPKFDLDNVDAYASYRTFERNPRNLRYAAIIDNYILEKPHAFLEGNFFCGYLVFSKRVIENNNIHKIKVSGRNEYEISDFFNFAENRQIIHNDLIWSDITVVDDIKKVEKLIKEN